MRKYTLSALLLSCLAFALVAAGSASSGLSIGDKAPDFKLKNIDGKMVSLSEYPDAKGAIVIFTCNHCPWVKKYETRIQALHETYAPKGYPVIGINSNDEKIVPGDSYEGMQKNYKEKGFTFPYLHDETQKIAKKYGAERTPEVYILQKEGKKFVLKYHGTIDDNPSDASAVKERYAANAVDELLAGKEVTEPTTKAIGCTIKWKK